MRMAYTSSIVDAFRIGIDPIPDWFTDKVTSNDAILHGDEQGRVSADINVNDRANYDYAEHGNYICRYCRSGDIWTLTEEQFKRFYHKIYIA